MNRCGETHPETGAKCVARGVHQMHSDGTTAWPNTEAIQQRQKTRTMSSPARRRKKGEELAGTATIDRPAPPFDEEAHLDGDRDGVTYERTFDLERLNAQMRRVYNVLRAGTWHTLADIAERTNDPEASVSARIRDLRKPEFGAFKVARRRMPGSNGQWQYRIEDPA